MARTGGRKGKWTSDVPKVYRDMLAEATSSPMQSDDDGRPTKKRRVGGHVVIQKRDRAEVAQSVSHSQTGHNTSIDDLFEEPLLARQHIIQSSSGDSSDSDVNWEEVELDGNANNEASVDSDEESTKKLNLTLGHNQGLHARSTRAKRKPISAVERQLRIATHKMHLCGLLVSLHFRNHWCNDANVHSALRKLLTRKIISYLNPKESQSQFQQSRSFMDGLQQASDVFRAHFKITARGMTRSRWADSVSSSSNQIPNDIDLPMHKEDFVSLAKDLRASRDVGAQLFCAMLRAAGVDVRLVCSLQPLPFRAGEKPSLPQQKYTVITPEAGSRHITPEVQSRHDTEDEDEVKDPASIGSLGGQSRFASNDLRDTKDSHASLPTHPKKISKRSIRESKYPVYWVEAFNEAVQKWVPVDPLVTQTVFKPSKFEPPAGERENNLSYVVAFDDDGSACDVTRRYAKAYNAKTRRERVESTKGGEIWWKRAMRMFKRRHRFDRDQLENAELATKEAAEPMPRNVQDFKDHPYYALERHMRRHEIIHPKREIGKVGTGRGHNVSALESVYRRCDVLIVQSADKWYRMGREIKDGEQPLKRVVARRPREAPVDPDDVEEENAGTALYAFHQTTLYQPPPVSNGRIPRNVYGNLDIYAPNMVPTGGLHIKHPETARAAKVLGIDYADAVTGFMFKGRHGTAVVTGAVIAAENAEAVHELLVAFQNERAHIEGERRSTEALAMWRRLLMGLRIRERIDGYKIEGEGDAEDAEPDDLRADEEDLDDDGGGFLPGHGSRPSTEPPAQNKIQTWSMDHDLNRQRVNPITEISRQMSVRKPRDLSIDASEDNDGGGFLIDDDADEGLQAAIERDIATKETTLDESKALDPSSLPPKATSEGAIADKSALQVPHEGVSAVSDDDKGSLISRDPDDEDLEPEWLD